MVVTMYSCITNSRPELGRFNAVTFNLNKSNYMKTKIYTITVKNKAKGGILLSRKNEGFNVHELLGILEQAKMDIHRRFLADLPADRMETIAVVVDKDLSINFKHKRIQAKLSMTTVAEKSGISKATISRLELGKDVMYSTVIALNKFYSSLNL